MYFSVFFRDIQVFFCYTDKKGAKMILKILLSILILLSSIASQAELPHFLNLDSPKKGIGDWEKVPFGDMRLISCTTGVKDLGMAVGGLQVRIEPNWILKKPTLKPLSDTLPSWIEAPARAGSGRNTVYQKELFIPIVYTKNPADKTDFEFGLQGVFPACQGETCMDLPIRISMNLGAEENDYTSMCAYILDKQSESPIPHQIHSVKGFATPDGDAIRFAFTGLSNVRIAFLQTTGQDNFFVSETQLEKNGLFMRVQTKAWPTNTSKEWTLITNKGVFNVPVLMQSDLPNLPPDSAPLSIWWMGWKWFFLTPLFIWWGLGVGKNKKLWQKQIRRLIILLPFVFTLRIIGQSFLPALPLQWNICYAFCLWGLVCLFPPQKIWSAFVLFLLWPNIVPLPQISIGMLILWGIVMLVEMGLPFLLLYLKADEIGKILREYKKKKFFVLNLTFLIPTLGLLAMGIYHLNTPPDYQDTLHPDGISVVCENCTAWKNLDAHFISPTDTLGNTLRQVYNRSQEVVIWQSNGERVILPPDISLKQTERFIKNWRNYHALYMP